MSESFVSKSLHHMACLHVRSYLHFKLCQTMNLSIKDKIKEPFQENWNINNEKQLYRSKFLTIDEIPLNFIIAISRGIRAAISLFPHFFLVFHAAMKIKAFFSCGKAIRMCVKTKTKIKQQTLLFHSRMVWAVAMRV
jgi:hypothetical protein